MNYSKKLFLYNRSILDTDSYQELLEIENSWISEIFDSIKSKTKIIKSKTEFQEAFDHLLLEERNAPSEDADYISTQISFDEFLIIIQEFAVDGLTEAQAFFPIIPRLPITAQMPILRVLIDEFGCGNFQQAHSSLYNQLLSELGLPTTIESYLDILNPESYAFLNIFYWLTKRAPDVEYFLGALAYLESMIPFAFKCFANACQRFNIVNSKYYTEHIHIDYFHAKDTLRALWEVETAIGLDYTKAWTGVQIASFITAQAFDAALKKAKKKLVAL
ncbi:iron-containing redox enzyme family protein [Fischerella sp. PCC 9605]|uniref:iron-containing redox enzyme family protein n=1 Tax=Fischerella sp. PCC 9605 TaxID=1173024 RepID=UPI00047A29D0|nr:iron-containing redox enzyme family protein [Fischerella sp. PCC 9605]